MVSFRKLTTTAGYLSFLLFFGVLAFLFFGFVDRETTPIQKVKFEVKEKAKGVNIWRVLKGKKYHLVAFDMIKNKNGSIELIKPKVWVFEKGKVPVFIEAEKAFVYPDNDVKAVGNVVLKRRDLKIFGRDVWWIDRTSVIRSNDAFTGYSARSKFKGKSFVYFLKPSVLKVKKVNIWLK